MEKVTRVFPSQIKWTYFYIDYYYDGQSKSLILILNGEYERYYRVTFKQVLGFRSMNEYWACLSSYSLQKEPFEILPDGSPANVIYGLHGVDLIFPPTVVIPGRHFFVFADNYHLDVYADAEPELEEISEEEAFKFLSKEPFVSIRDMSFMDRYKPSQVKEEASDDEE